MTVEVVHIKHEAFFNMIASATETFKRECLGIIFGISPTQKKNEFLIMNAISLQSVRSRKNTEVTQSALGQKRLSRLFDGAHQVFPVVGMFHSHPEWGIFKGSPEMSEADIRSMIGLGFKLEFIIVVSSRKKGFQPWEMQEDGSIKGSLSRYNFHFNAYTLHGGTAKKLRIFTPVALRALNKAVFSKTR